MAGEGRERRSTRGFASRPSRTFSLILLCFAGPAAGWTASSSLYLYVVLVRLHVQTKQAGTESKRRTRKASQVLDASDLSPENHRRKVEKQDSRSFTSTTTATFGRERKRVGEKLEKGERRGKGRDETVLRRGRYRERWVGGENGKARTRLRPTVPGGA